ncbi:hypothetical protein F0H32_10100 [Xanthomonas translucens pv. undulosa]|nr:hypothetical protein F0H32_10100 [Xanthomonas translucens pv. undulosa]
MRRADGLRVRVRRHPLATPIAGVPSFSMDRPLKTLPASFAQQRLWFLARLDPRGSTAYHLAGGLRLHGSLDEDALHAALDRIVERHEVLRTCLVEVQG